MNRIERDIFVKQDHNNFARISYVQGTNEIPLVFHIRDYTVSSGSTARVYVRRPDGTSEYDTAVLSGNDVTVNVKDTMFSVIGISKLQIRIAKGSKKLVSFAVDVYVEKNYADGGIKSENATDIFDQAFEGIEEATRKAEQAAKNIQDKADRGDFTGSIQIRNVETGEPGTKASIKNVGTPKDAVLDIAIPKGDRGASMRMKGRWEENTAYVNNDLYTDVVTHEGSSYSCKKSHTASKSVLPTNTEYWECIAKKGETGNIENISTIPIDFQEATERANIEPGDSIPTALGKLSKLYADLESNVLGGLRAPVQQQIDGMMKVSKSKKLKTAGWYRILNFGYFDNPGYFNTGGLTLRLRISKNYYNTPPESVDLTISVGYQSRPHVVVNDRETSINSIKQIRIYFDNVEHAVFLEFYYSENEENDVAYSFESMNAYATLIEGLDMDPGVEDGETMFVYNLHVGSDAVTSGLRNIVTGNVNIDDYFDAAHVGSWGHHSGVLSGIPDGISGIGTWNTAYSIGDGDEKYLKQTYSPYDKSIFAQRIRINSTVSDWSVFYPIPFQVYDTPYHAISSEATDWQQFLYHLWYHIQNLFNWSNIGQIDIISPGTWAAHSNFIGRFHHNPRTNCIIGTVTISTEMYSLYWNPSSGDWNKVVRQRFVGGGGNS